MAIASVLVGLLVHESKPGHMSGAPGLKPHAHVLENFGKLPLAFEENRGQSGGAADFVTRGGNFQVMLDRAGETFLMAGAAGAPMPAKNAKASPMGLPLAIVMLAVTSQVGCDNGSVGSLSGSGSGGGGGGGRSVPISTQTAMHVAANNMGGIPLT